MCILHSVTNCAEQLEPVRNRKLMPFAVFVNWQTFDEFHYKIGKPIFGCTAIKQSSDVGMIEIG